MTASSRPIPHKALMGALLLFAAALSITLLAGLGSNTDTTAGDAIGDATGGATGAALDTAAAPAVRTVAPLKVPSTYRLTAPGRLRARDGVALIGEVTGKIVWIADQFVLGGRVQPGDLLLRIDQTDYKAAVAAAEAGLDSARASLDLAQKTFARRTDLARAGTLSEQAGDDASANLAIARAAIRQAQATLDLARHNLARTEIRAPFPARVIEDRVSPETYVAPGQQLGVLADTRMGEMQAGLSPSDTQALARALARISPRGERLKAWARPNEGSLGTATLEGWIDRFNPVIDRTARTAQIIALFPDAFGRQWDGKIFGDDYMTLEVAIPIAETVWQLPAGSVRKDAFIWAVRAQRLSRIPVQPLYHTRDHSLVVSQQPLAGEAILATLLNEEYDGKPVRVVEADSAPDLDPGPDPDPGPDFDPDPDSDSDPATDTRPDPPPDAGAP